MTRTYNEIKEIVDNKGYLLLDEYYGLNFVRKIIIRDEIGYKYDVSFANLMKEGRGIAFVDKGNPFSIENIHLWISINRNDYLLCSTSYDGARKKLIFRHLKCGEEFEMSWACFYGGHSCSFCCGQKVIEWNSLSYLRPDLRDEWHPCNKITPEEVTCGSKKEAYWICPDCGYGENKEWFISVKRRTRNGCPACSSSVGEKKIKKVLLSMKFNSEDIETEKTFDGCVYRIKLRYDLYIEKYNLCIEYHGKQHYEENEFFGGGKAFIEQLEKDKIKEDYCYNNGINLLIIPYWEFDNIENILEQTLFG